MFNNNNHNNNNNNHNSTSGGICFSSILFLVFLVLKLTHVIEWSWWWVTAPLWIPASIIILVVITALIYLACINDK